MRRTAALRAEERIAVMDFGLGYHAFSVAAGRLRRHDGAVIFSFWTVCRKADGMRPSPTAWG